MNNFRFLPVVQTHQKCLGLTLAELLIATGLLIFILLTVGILDIASRKFYSKAEKGSAALQDVSLAMEYIQKSSQRAIGDVSSGHAAFQEDATGASFCSGYTNGWRFIIDVNQNGIFDDPATTDGYNTFCYDNANHTVTFTDEMGTPQVIARRIVRFNDDNTAEPGVVFFSLASRDNPSAAASADNPDIYLEARSYLRSASLK